MFKRLHIETRAAPLPEETPRIEVRRDYDRCIGCGLCVKACVYGVHMREPALLDLTRLALPIHDRCVGCHRCVNECPKGALELRPHPDHAALGDAYYTPELVETLLYEAETGRVPVSGAGYRGRFAGPGFDGIWTDMSEIVRPTRDGIHGREIISTEISLGRKPERLTFSLDGRLQTRLSAEARLQLPFVFLPPPFPLPLDKRRALAELLSPVMEELGSLLVLDEDARAPAGGIRAQGLGIRAQGLGIRAQGLGIRLTSPATADPARYKGYALVEIRDSAGALQELETIHAACDVVVSVLIGASAGASERAVALAEAGAGLLHLAATPHAGWPDDAGKHLIDALREAERALVEAGLRDEVTVLASGGIARAEHVPKAMLCGADAVGLDVACLIALGMRRFDGALGHWPPPDLKDVELGRQRVRNLANSWRDQLLEVMGAMGLREARRMQGEEGRAIFYEELEREFLQLFTPPGRKECDPSYG